ncbi:MAG: hypothetical protein OEZ22_13830 [Spirochaetia bacterium]|nr:hypothetical protein [Spirochaetia bacterium]
MESDNFIELYFNSGIWGWMDEYARRNKALGWYIWIIDNHKIFPISPVDGLDESKKKSIEYDGNIWPKNINIEKKFDNYSVIIPVDISTHIIYYWEINFKYKPEITDIIQLKEKILFLLYYESINKELYPSFIPFLLPIFGENKKLNDEIVKNKSIYFINGQNGTGKKSFIQCFMLYNYKYFLSNTIWLESELLIKKIITNLDIELVIVSEIAFLNKHDQDKLLKMINSSEKQLFFILSIYDPQLLLDNSILNEDLVQLLQKHKVITSSIKKRMGEVQNTLTFWLKIKNCYYNIFIERINLLNNNLSNNFNDVQKNLFFVEQISNIESEMTILKERKLRDLVMDLEIKAIEYAKNHVGYSQHKVSKFLGISRGSLQHKLKKYKIYGVEWEKDE